MPCGASWSSRMFRSLRGKVAEVQKAAEVDRLSDRREHAKELVALQVPLSPRFSTLRNHLPYPNLIKVG